MIIYLYTCTCIYTYIYLNLFFILHYVGEKHIQSASLFFIFRKNICNAFLTQRGKSDGINFDSKYFWDVIVDF